MSRGFCRGLPVMRGGYVVAEVYEASFPGDDFDEQEAAAKRFAAAAAVAPELLEALNLIVDCIECEDGFVSNACMNLARAAIAKARG